MRGQRSATPASVPLSHSDSSSACVSHYHHLNTHAHTGRNSANAHKTLIEHLNVNLTFFRGGKKQLGARMFRCFSTSSLPSSRPDQGSFILRKISVIASSAHLSRGANVKDGGGEAGREKREGDDRGKRRIE